MDTPAPQPRRRIAAVARAFDAASPVALCVVAAALAVRLATGWFVEHDALFVGIDALVLAYFAAEVGARLFAAQRRLAHLRTRWFDLMVVAPLVQAPLGLGTAGAWYLIHRAAELAAVSTRTRPVERLVTQLWVHPARMMVISFAGAIAVGALLLTTPWATPGTESLGAVDALFTATSAVCVTGLIVRDTGSEFTLFGQLVILTLIQLGALGLMTFSVSLVLALGRSLAKSRAVVMQDMLDQESVRDVLSLIRFIAAATLVIEAIGAVAVFACFSASKGLTVATAPRLAYEAIFHSISAFCNAGFSLFRTSFEAYHTHPGLNAVVASLIILGGLGFPVLRDLVLLGTRRRVEAGRTPVLRTQTKVVLRTSAVLILVGAALFYVLDARHTLAGMTPGNRVLASFFQSVTARTAGFNTVNIGRVGHAGLLLLMLLMYIGASPGSTGGGVKTTTAAIVWASAWAALRGRARTELCRRSVPVLVVRRAVALVVLSLLLLAATGIALMSIEAKPFEKVAFEAVSAFGTVGLSAGITGSLTPAGRLIITGLMFVGRLGPLTLAYSLLGDVRPGSYAYPEDRIMVG